jgi:hypothetical protein
MPVGPVTIRPLLQASAPAHLLRLIKSLAQTPSGAPSSSTNKLLPPLLRALRNLLVTTADLVWGHLWGVGAEKRVISTGLFGDEVPDGETSGKGKAVAGKTRSWRAEGVHSLGLCFEVRPILLASCTPSRYASSLHRSKGTSHAS